MNADVSRRIRVLRGLFSGLTENIGYKLVALALAVALMISVKGAGTVTRTVDVPVTALLPAPTHHGRVLISPLPDVVRVTIRGPSSLIGSLRGDQLGPMQLDLRDGARRSLMMEDDFIRLPRGTTVVGFVPAHIELAWDTLVTRTLPIRPSLTGTLGARLRMAAVNPDPPTLTLRGPASEIEPLDHIRTDDLDVSSLTAGHHDRRLGLVAPSPLVALGTIQRVRLGLDVVPLVAERRFERLAVAALGARAEVRPPVVDVVVRGDPDAVEALLPSQVVPFVEVDGAQRGSESSPIHLHPLPRGLELARIEPGQAVVTIAH